MMIRLLYRILSRDGIMLSLPEYVHSGGLVKGNPVTLMCSLILVPVVVGFLRAFSGHS